jgi:hypothetical protein
MRHDGGSLAIRQSEPTSADIPPPKYQAKTLLSKGSPLTKLSLAISFILFYQVIIFDLRFNTVALEHPILL